MQYRSEIDGLRAVAVLPVILFHAGFGVFGGGYVGVDIFFVISGYLITGILIEDLEQGRFSIARFYERRARRILPALFVVMLVCIPFAYLWMAPSQLRDFGESLIAVVLFLSNVLFWQEEGYFAAAADLKPLLHTWSLAVEEQYYLLFPALLMGIWRFGRRRVFWGIATLAACSLVLSEWGWRHQPSANFYLAPTRAWELLAGSLCAFLTIGRPQKSNTILSAAGLGLIVLAIFFFDADTPFPSVYALVPVVGAVLIIIFAAPGTWVAQLLSSPPFVGIGLISYSAYLWHQPLFAFARLRSLAEPGAVAMAALTVASLVLAWATWRWVEHPFRRRPDPALTSRRAVFLASAIAGAATVGIGATVNNSQFYFSYLDAEQRTLYSYLSYKDTATFSESYRKPDCFQGSTDDSFAFFKKERCLAVRTDQPDYLLMGDSHAAHLWKALSVVYPDINFMQATASGCKPLHPLEGQKRCTDLLDFVWNEFLPDHHVDAIILSARWNDDSAALLSDTIRKLKPYADRIYVFGPTVEYNDALPNILLQLRTNDRMTSSVSPFLRASHFEINADMKTAASATDATYVDFVPHLCSDGQCLVFADNGVPLFWDDGHFTLDGAITVIQAVDPFRTTAAALP